jgi:hypothetical protein
MAEEATSELILSALVKENNNNDNNNNTIPDAIGLLRGKSQ